MAFRRLFDDKFIADKQRKSDYRKWSERAIVVGFNGDTQTYDIVITTERLAGVSRRTLNKTIRNVKSTIPGSSLTFSPGDAVLVGYVAEKREHPIIIGGGGNVVQEAAIVTIGSNFSEDEVEGGGPELEGIGSPGFINLNCTGFLVDSLTGSTTTLTVNCDTLDVNGCFVATIDAPTNCGCGVYDWSLSGGTAGFVVSDQGAAASAVGLTTTLAPFGLGGFQLKICPPTNNTSVSGNATGKTGINKSCAAAGCCCTNPAGAESQNCNATFRCETFGCDGVFISTPGIGTCCPTSAQLSATFTPCFGSVGAAVLNTCINTFKCDDIISVKPCIGVGPDLFGPEVDLRTPSMISQGCAPCKLVMGDDSIITSTDACGRMLSLLIEVTP